MKKRTSRVSRRIVSLLMSMVLTLTLVTPAAFATEVVDGSSTTIVEGDTNPADTNPGGDTEGKDDVDKNTEDGKDEQQPAEPDDEDKVPGEGEDDVNASSNEADTQEGEGTDTPMVAQRTVTVERYRTDAAYEVKIVVGVEEDGTTEKLDTTYAIGSDTKTVKLRLTTADYAGEPVYIKTALDDVLVTEGKNQTPALTKDAPTLEYPLPEDGDVTLYYGTQEDFVTAWYGDGSAKDYTIRSAEELAYLAQLVNGGNDFAGKTVALARDVDLSAVCNEESGKSWTPIGNADTKPFKGEFDGCNYTINNLYVTQGNRLGLFGCVNGTIKNTTVSGIVCADANAYAGGVVGFLKGGTVENCTNKATVATGESGYAGGIFGKSGNDNSITVQGCSNEGEVTGEKTGGIVGGLEVKKTNAPKIEIINCVNIGKICSAQYGGGIVGYNLQKKTVGNTKYYNTTLDNCRNEGNVTICDSDGNMPSYIGGIVGYGESIKESKNLSNTGSVTNESGTAAGLVAFISDKGSVTNSYNHGNVTGAEGKVFGLCGKNVTNSYYICKLNNADEVTMMYVHNNIEQLVTYEETTQSYKVGENTLVKTLNDNKGDGLKWFVNIPKGITKPIFVKLWDGTDHPDYVPDGTEKEVHVTYDPNGGGGNGTSVSVAVTLNEDGTVKEPGTHTILDAETAKIGEKDFCELKDWNIEANGEGTTYTIGQDISVSEDLTLYAQWHPLWKGSGMESDPYQIENEADWLKMQKYAGKYSNYPDMWFALMDDITLDNYEPFFFRGNLMGNGNTITVNVSKVVETGKYNRGLFSSITGSDAGMRIENLTIAGSVAAYQYAGGLAGSARGNVTLDNVTNTAIVCAEGIGTYVAGGLIGHLADKALLVVNNCRNTGSVTGYVAGGLVGDAEGTLSKIELTNCNNRGAVTSTGKSAAGLVVGSLNGYGLTYSYTLKGCINSGAVTSASDAAGVSMYGTAEGCTNSGTVTGSYAAGILGNGIAVRCTNTASAVVHGRIGAAGIVNSSSVGSSTPTSAKFCANLGKVVSDAGQGVMVRAYGIAVGGTIENCFTYNNETHVPVAGATGRNCTVTNSYYLANSKDEFPSTMGGEYATLTDFTSGKVAWGVDGGTGAHKNYWTQGANNYPVPIGEGTSTSYYRAKAECGTGGTVTIKRGDGRTGDADNAVYGPSGTNVTVTATPKDSSFALKSLTLDLMSTGTTSDHLANPGSFALGAANAKVVATFASAGSGGGSGSGSGSGSGTGAGDESDEGLQDGVNMDVEYNVKGLVLSAYTEWGSNGGGKTFSQWLKDSPNVLRALIANSLDNMAAAAAAKKTDEASALAQALLASLNEHSGVTGKDGDAISKALQRFMTSGTEATFSTWLATSSGMASGTLESIFTQYTDSLLALADRLYTKWESSGTSMTFPAWLDAQQVSMENLSETAEEPDTDTTDESQTTEAPEDVPDGQESEGQVSGNSIWEIIGTAVRENPIIVWSIVAVVAALVIVGAVRRYHKVKRDERDDNGAE